MDVDRREAALAGRDALLLGRDLLGVGGEELLEEAVLPRRVLEDAVDLVNDGREARLEIAEELIGLLEVAAREVDVAAQQRRLVRPRRVREARLELVEEVDRRVLVVALVHRPGRLEERLGDARRVLRDLEVVVERVLRPAALVRHAAERDPREVADLEVPSIDEERVLVGVGGRRDRAELRLGVLEAARLGCDDALEVAGVRVEAAPPAHLPRRSGPRPPSRARRSARGPGGRAARWPRPGRGSPDPRGPGGARSTARDRRPRARRRRRAGRPGRSRDRRCRARGSARGNATRSAARPSAGARRRA